ncbi:pyridine nucleotide-disulfide oxidoreductase [Halomicronema hongdechloris C2206]|uniref:Pyridine nucleotide-disulfide oxidoreductase n=1 Tax=Halomicronema hongdechloris C2206 TaxID=1641165 RepID=A0A1Z3HH43_9CYAN|nr:NAD(P)/FAD-dependent oxidoreductase [Halomicronema hongdechloris]ASC69595.1 pyridine nucleotide-disulfide oxidoreductase [Halomicronema hongdechloris C2206]
MAVDYDLVVLGGTWEGREVALTGALQGARVALVEPTVNPLQAQLWGQALMALGRQWRDIQQATEWLPLTPDSLAGNLVQQWARAVAQLGQETVSRHHLALQGVDVVTDAAQFVSHPRLAVSSGRRQLTARAYLIATGAQTPPPEAVPLAARTYLTPETLGQLETWPRHLTILGSTPPALALSQAFRSLGVRVALVLPTVSPLPGEDPETVQLILSQLQVDGIELHRQRSLRQVAPRPAGWQVTTEDADWLTDHILVATAPLPAIASLNLEAVGISWGRQGLPVSDTLQTHHPRIFALGSVLGGYGLSALARYEGHIALANALYLPRSRVQYHHIPYRLETIPPLDRVGLTAQQAQRYYGDAARVIQVGRQHTLQAQMSNDPTGFCRLIVHRNGTVLGAHIIGDRSRDLIQTVALLMTQGGKINALARLPTAASEAHDLLRQAAQQWQQNRWQPGRWRRDWAENWFNWRRSAVR